MFRNLDLYPGQYDRIPGYVCWVSISPRLLETKWLAGEAGDKMKKQKTRLYCKFQFVTTWIEILHCLLFFPNSTHIQRSRDLIFFRFHAHFIGESDDVIKIQKLKPSLISNCYMCPEPSKILEFVLFKGKIRIRIIFWNNYRTCYTLVTADPDENNEYKNLMSSQLNWLTPGKVK